MTATSRVGRKAYPNQSRGSRLVSAALQRPARGVTAGTPRSTRWRTSRPILG